MTSRGRTPGIDHTAARYRQLGPFTLSSAVIMSITGIPVNGLERRQAMVLVSIWSAKGEGRARGQRVGDDEK